MKSPQEIARMASELMEALSEYIEETDKEIIADLKAGRRLLELQTRTRNLFAELYGPMIKWKFDVERIARNG